MKNDLKKIIYNPYTGYIIITLSIILLFKYIYLIDYSKFAAKILLLELSTVEQLIGTRFNVIYIAQFSIHIYLVIAILSQHFVWLNNYIYMLRFHSFNKYILSLIISTFLKIMILIILNYITIGIFCQIWDNVMIIILNCIKESFIFLIICLFYYICVTVYKENIPIYMIAPMILVLIDVITGTSFFAYTSQISIAFIYIFIYLIIILILITFFCKKAKIFIWR